MKQLRLAAAITAGTVLLVIVPLAVANVPGVQITSRPANATDSTSATFQFSNSLDAGARFECQLDGAAFSPCLTPFTTVALTDGLHTFTVRDAGLTSDEDSFAWTVDTTPPSTQTIYLTPPGKVRHATATTGDRTVLLRWALPAATDIASVRVERTVIGDPTSKVVSHVLGTTFRSSGLLNGVTYRFVLVRIDKDGNSSQPVVVSATPNPSLLTAPKAGARVTEPPLLRWAPVAPAGYFNVQLYRDGTKILSAWPSVVHLQLASSWSFGKHTFTLKPGVYTWYVWPGLGARAEVRYGKLLGRSSFVVNEPGRL